MAIAVGPRSGSASFEDLVAVRGERSGAPMVVAVHSTTLGPALGGVRVWPYDHPDDAERDAARLARGMTLKAAAAGLDLGGGKGVVCAPGGGFDAAGRRAALLDFGDLVESFGGRYITAEDVGTSPEDIAVVAERTAHVTGLPTARGGSGDPSPVTAVGVLAAMRACAAARWGSRRLAGLRVVVIGLGHVGARLARLLREEGCELVVSDIAPDHRVTAERLGAEWVEPLAAPTARCDLLAPCALGGLIDRHTAPRLRCEVVCGAANNQLAEDSLAATLADRGALYAPDFIANAGGLINVHAELRGQDRETALRRAQEIEEAMRGVLAAAASSGATPLAAAHRLARHRLGAGVRD